VIDCDDLIADGEVDHNHHIWVVGDQGDCHPNYY